jgi:hypothetical protein
MNSSKHDSGFTISCLPPSPNLLVRNRQQKKYFSPKAFFYRLVDHPTNSNKMTFRFQFVKLEWISFCCLTCLIHSSNLTFFDWTTNKQNFDRFLIQMNLDMQCNTLDKHDTINNKKKINFMKNRFNFNLTVERVTIVETSFHFFQFLK